MREYKSHIIILIIYLTIQIYIDIYLYLFKEDIQMAVILVGGEKGGTGKSTTSINLAIMASVMDHDFILVDATVKQASSAKFINRRNELGIKPTPSCVRIQGKYLHEN